MSLKDKVVKAVLCIAISSASNFIFFGIEANAQQRICKVTDPTGTPLNIRNSPGGSVVGKIRNGRKVQIISIAYDNSGKPWAYIGSGYVLREFISCFSR